jgi:hypothetical protein
MSSSAGSLPKSEAANRVYTGPPFGEVSLWEAEEEEARNETEA